MELAGARGEVLAFADDFRDAFETNLNEEWMKGGRQSFVNAKELFDGAAVLIENVNELAVRH